MENLANSNLYSSSSSAPIGTTSAIAEQTSSSSSLNHSVGSPVATVPVKGEESLAAPLSNTESSVGNGLTTQQMLLGHSPDIERLKSALACIPPSDDLKVIAYHYLAPLAKAAIEFPEIEGRMKDLALIWAVGELHDGKYPGLTAITRGGLTGKALFEEVWKVFILDTSYKGPRRSLGSIYHIAKAAGWSYF